MIPPIASSTIVQAIARRSAGRRYARYTPRSTVTTDTAPWAMSPGWGKKWITGARTAVGSAHHHHTRARPARSAAESAMMKMRVAARGRSCARSAQYGLGPCWNIEPSPIPATRIA